MRTSNGNGGAKIMGMDPVPEAEVDAWVADRTKAGAVVTMSGFDWLAMAIGAGARGKIRRIVGDGKGIAPWRSSRKMDVDCRGRCKCQYLICQKG
jgi:hypothetical protein